MVISQSAFILWRPGKDDRIHWLGYEQAENGDCWFDSKDFKDVKIFLDKDKAEEEIEHQKRIYGIEDWRIKEFKIEF